MPTTRAPLDRGRQQSRSLETWRLAFLRGDDALMALREIGLTGYPRLGSPAGLKAEHDRVAAAEGRWIPPAYGTEAEHVRAYEACQAAWQVLGAAFLATGETRDDGTIWALEEFGEPKGA